MCPNSQNCDGTRLCDMNLFDIPSCHDIDEGDNERACQCYSDVVIEEDCLVYDPTKDPNAEAPFGTYNEIKTTVCESTDSEVDCDKCFHDAFYNNICTCDNLDSFECREHLNQTVDKRCFHYCDDPCEDKVCDASPPALSSKAVFDAGFGQ